ncbi:MAG: hypothetical protein KatS3mg013_1213 [Actinomycetota bacterium]|jgi:uncharacterized protein YggE|nr:MAG: hypothetical protein KatS3mg013_1213 [Actinomycetota bacterium]
MRRSTMTAAAFLAGAVLAMSLPAVAQEREEDPGNRRSITVTGTAIAETEPDEAIVTLGVRSEANSAREALAQSDGRMRRVLEALRALGLGDADLATSSIDLSPRWDDRGEAVVGYVATNRVQATVRELDLVGRVIDDAVGAGANLVEQIVFRAREADATAALTEAVEDARAKAEAMASAAGASLAAVLTIEELSAAMPVPVWGERAVAEAVVGAPTPVEPPTIEHEVSVRVTWALG